MLGVVLLGDELFGGLVFSVCGYIGGVCCFAVCLVCGWVTVLIWLSCGYCCVLVVCLRGCVLCCDFLVVYCLGLVCGLLLLDIIYVLLFPIVVVGFTVLACGSWVCCDCVLIVLVLLVLLLLRCCLFGFVSV